MNLDETKTFDKKQTYELLIQISNGTENRTLNHISQIPGPFAICESAFIQIIFYTPFNTNFNRTMTFVN